MLDALRLLAPPLLAVGTALAVDRATARRRLEPPGFAPRAESPAALAAARRVSALLLLAAVLWVGVFAPLGAFGTAQSFDPRGIEAPQLFLLHLLFALAIGGWMLLGFGPDALRRLGGQLGIALRGVGRELGVGVAAGVAAWVGVLTTLLGLGAILWALGGEEILPATPSPLIPFIAGLPLVLRLGLSLSAGLFEELFFRGFLQPRVGIALSSVLFVLAHLSYEQPLMLVGVTLLSLIFAALVRWRGNIWAAVAAHATFDALQLLLVIPWAMRFLPSEGPS